MKTRDDPPTWLAHVIDLGIDTAERGRLPDLVVRRAIRRLIDDRRRELVEIERRRGGEYRESWEAHMRAAEIAPLAASANEQHYDVSPAFFELVLGPHRKYSCGLWENGVRDLSGAEEAMLALTCRRAGIEDGMTILDLGCGWGSLTTWIARSFPSCRIVSVSNAKEQCQHLRGRCDREGFSHVDVRHADANHFEPDARFDRIVSVEMFEHLRNWPRAFGRVARWLEPDGRFFLHVFCHRAVPYPFDGEGPGDWMARNFFTGGMMPSFDLPYRVEDDLRVEQSWRVSGDHYQRTSEAWLANLDRRRDGALELFGRGRTRAEAKREVGRWRLFFLAVAELFGARGGEEWLVGHYLMAPEGTAAAS